MPILAHVRLLSAKLTGLAKFTGLAGCGVGATVTDDRWGVRVMLGY
jgi:hypothetical protein